MGSHHGFLLQGLPTVFSLWFPWLPVLLSHMGLSLVLTGAPADGYQTLLFAVFFPAPLAALLSRTANTGVHTMCSSCCPRGGSEAIGAAKDSVVPGILPHSQGFLNRTANAGCPPLQDTPLTWVSDSEPLLLPPIPSTSEAYYSDHSPTLTAPNAIACWTDQMHKCLQIYPTTSGHPQDPAPIQGFAEAWAYRWIGWSPRPFSQA